MFQQVAGAPTGTARVLMTDHPKNGELSSWEWDYPVGAGQYAALFPKSLYDYQWDKFPVHVVLEQFSPVLPNNYKESSYPVAVYRWHAENPSKKRVTVSVLLSWTNMGGWFRTYTHDFQGALNQGNQNQFHKESVGTGGTMSGVGKFLKEKNPAIKNVGVDPVGTTAIRVVDAEPNPRILLDNRESTIDDIRPFVEAGVRKGHTLVVIKADRKVPCGLVQKIAKAATAVEGVQFSLGVQDKKSK